MSGDSVSILALIPARSGSKTVVDKNIRMFRGKPMMAWSIEQALASRMITRTIVSTDSPQYAEIARQHGAETPFLRPAELAQDDSPDIGVFLHALEWLKENEGYTPEICVHLRPTYPTRRVEDIDKAIRILLDRPKIESVRSIQPLEEPPFKMWFRNKDGDIRPITECDIPEAYNAPRQILPQGYVQNACIDVVRTKTILEKRSMSGQAIHGYVMDHFHDIDTEEQFRAAAAALPQNEHPADDRSKVYCFDIDGVIAGLTPDNQYNEARPIRENIDIINRLYEQGHRIILFTARGSATGLDWRKATADQMTRWGLKYHELVFGKPAADYYIDDRLVDIERIRDSLNKAERA